MEVFKDAWFAIDTKARGRISVTDLWVYMKKNNYEDSFVNKWMKLFNKDDSGFIDLEYYCEVLGLTYKEIWAELRLQVSGGGGLPPGVEVISGDMATAWQIKLAQLCIEGLRSTAVMKDVPKTIKAQADRLYNQLWHVVIVNGQFWCYYGHEPGHSFVFRYEKNIFIVWKTPMA